MLLELRPVPLAEIETIIPILKDAEEAVERMRSFLLDGRHVSYSAHVEGEMVGAASVCWQEQESEIEYIAVVPEMRGKGYGKAIIAHLVQEARRRNLQSLLVGTSTTSLENMIFYQKCGFRMDYVRHNFFSYLQPPVIDNGLPIIDMIVLRYTL